MTISLKVNVYHHDCNELSLSTFANIADVYVRWFDTHQTAFLLTSGVIILLWFSIWMYIDIQWGNTEHRVANVLYFFIYLFSLYVYIAIQNMYENTRRWFPLSSDWYITNKKRGKKEITESQCCLTQRSHDRTQKCYFEWYDQSTKYYWQIAEEDQSASPHTPLSTSVGRDGDSETKVIYTDSRARLSRFDSKLAVVTGSKARLEVIGHKWHREQNLIAVKAIKWLGYTLIICASLIVPAMMGIRTWQFYEHCDSRRFQGHCHDKDFIFLTSIGNAVIFILFWMASWIASAAFLIFMDTLGHIRHFLIVYLQNLKFIAMNKELGCADEVKVTYRDAVPFYNNIASYVHILSRIWQRLLTVAMVILFSYILHQIYQLWTNNWDFITVIVVSVTFFLLSWSLLWIAYVNTMGDRIITWFTAVELEKSFIRATRNDEISGNDETEPLTMEHRNLAATQGTEELLASMIFIEHIKYTDVKFKIYGWRPNLAEIFRAVIAGSVSLLLTGVRAYYSNTGD